MDARFYEVLTTEDFSSEGLMERAQKFFPILRVKVL
jgi:hypothetical protein